MKVKFFFVFFLFIKWFDVFESADRALIYIEWKIRDTNFMWRSDFDGISITECLTNMFGNQNEHRIY